LQGQYTSGPSSIAQKASVAAFNGDQSCVEQMRTAFQRRRDLVVSLCRDIPGIRLNVPDGAFYLFPDLSHYFGKRFGDRVVSDAGELAMYLLEEGHVATVGGGAFGAPPSLRVSNPTSEENQIEASRRIKHALAELK
jgi:aspartate aminotransferase